MQDRAAGVDDVRHIAVPLGPDRRQHGLAQPRDHPAGIVQVQQRRADAVATHRADAMRDDEPALRQLDRAAAIANLHELQGSAAARISVASFHDMQIVGRDQLQRLAIRARQHRVPPADAAREQRHALVADRIPAQRHEGEASEVVGSQHFRRDSPVRNRRCRWQSR